MQTLMPASYSLPTVALSFLIAAIGAFVALTAVGNVSEGATAGARRLNLWAAAVALGGIGVWSMHFIGMLSLRVNMGVSYSLVETIVSLVAAVVACYFALRWVAQERTLPRIAVAGVLLGLAVCVMHYLGMYGMRFNGFLNWSAEGVGASVAIAIVAACAGLWLAFAVRGLPARVGASLVIAVAVCAMHYTGMAAADFVCTTPNPQEFLTGPWLVTSLDLPWLVSITALGMACVIAIDQAFQRLAMQPGTPAAAVRRAR